jgi:hypothetical protein
MSGSKQTMKPSLLSSYPNSERDELFRLKNSRSSRNITHHDEEENIAQNLRKVHNVSDLIVSITEDSDE